MSIHPRIMLLEPNRYRALLLQRSLKQRDSAAIVVRFSDPDQALAELSRNSYIAAVVDSDSAPDLWRGFLQSVAQKIPGLKLVVVTPGPISAADSDELAGYSKCHLVRLDEAAELFSRSSDWFNHSPEDFDGQPVKYLTSSLSGLIVAGQ